MITAAEMRDTALIYAGYGWEVIPLWQPVKTVHGYQCSCRKSAECKSPAKHPLSLHVPNGLNDASKEPEVIKKWFQFIPYNIAIITGAKSGIVVVDIDPRHGGDESLKALEKEYGPLPLTQRFLTGGGGEHILFRHPGFHIANSTGEIGEGIDVRGDQGYIVAPPSLHVSGRQYTISVDHHPEDVLLAEMPEWLLKLMCQPHKRAEKPGNIRKNGDNPKQNHKPRKTPEQWRETVSKKYLEGNRNNTLTSIAGLLMRNRNIDPLVALELLFAWNQTHCDPPLDNEEVVRTANSVARMEIKRRGGTYDA